MSRANRYIPALSFRWLTWLYDPLLKWGMHEETFKRRLIQRADLQPKMKVLDLGCGTGTLTVMLKLAAPQVQVIGLDGDPEVLSIARSKAQQLQLDIRWDYGMAYALPYPDDSFDSVFSSLVVHHLSGRDKVRAFREVRRVLRPGGRFHLLDFGEPFNLLTRLQASLMRHLEETRDNFRGLIVPMLREAGFADARQVERMGTIVGPVNLIEASKDSR